MLKMLVIMCLLFNSSAVVAQSPKPDQDRQRHGVIYFDNRRTAAIIKQIQRIYNIPVVVYGAGINPRSYSLFGGGTVNVDGITLKELMEIMTSESVHISYDEHNNSIVISKP